MSSVTESRSGSGGAPAVNDPLDELINPFSALSIKSEADLKLEAVAKDRFNPNTPFPEPVLNIIEGYVGEICASAPPVIKPPAPLLELINTWDLFINSPAPKTAPTGNSKSPIADTATATQTPLPKTSATETNSKEVAANPAPVIVAESGIISRIKNLVDTLNLQTPEHVKLVLSCVSNLNEVDIISTESLAKFLMNLKMSDGDLECLIIQIENNIDTICFSDFSIPLAYVDLSMPNYPGRSILIDRLADKITSITFESAKRCAYRELSGSQTINVTEADIFYGRRNFKVERRILLIMAKAVDLPAKLLQAMENRPSNPTTNQLRTCVQQDQITIRTFLKNTFLDEFKNRQKASEILLTIPPLEQRRIVVDFVDAIHASWEWYNPWGNPLSLIPQAGGLNELEERFKLHIQLRNTTQNFDVNKAYLLEQATKLGVAEKAQQLLNGISQLTQETQIQSLLVFLQKEIETTLNIVGRCLLRGLDPVLPATERAQLVAHMLSHAEADSTSDTAFMDRHFIVPGVISHIPTAFRFFFDRNQLNTIEFNQLTPLTAPKPKEDLDLNILKQLPTVTCVYINVNVRSLLALAELPQIKKVYLSQVLFKQLTSQINDLQLLRPELKVFTDRLLKPLPADEWEENSNS